MVSIRCGYSKSSSPSGASGQLVCHRMHILSIIAPNFQFPWKSKSRCEYDDDAGKKKGKASAKALDSRIVAGQFERASERALDPPFRYQNDDHQKSSLIGFQLCGCLHTLKTIYLDCSSVYRNKKEAKCCSYKTKPSFAMWRARGAK